MQSQNGDVQLSVTLDTKGIKSDVQKLRDEIQKEVGKKKTSDISNSVINSDKAVKEVGQVIDEMEKLKQVKEELASGELSMDTQAELDRLQEILDKKKQAEQITQQEIQSEQQVTDNVRSAADVYREVADTQARVAQEMEQMQNASQGVSEGQQQVVEDCSLAVREVERMKTALADTNAIAEDLAYDLNMFEQGNKYSDEFLRLKSVAQDLTKEFNKSADELYKMEILGDMESQEYADMAIKAAELADQLRDVNGMLDDMRRSGEAYTEGINNAELKQVEKAYDAITNKITLKRQAEKQAAQEAKESARQEAQATREAEKEQARLAKEAEKAGKSMQQIGTNGSRAMNNVAKNTKKLNKEMKETNKHSRKIKLNFLNILGAAVGIRSLYALFNKLRTSVTEGIKSLALMNNGNNKTNESISMLMSSLNQLKNSLGAAFAPILTAVAPALNYLIGLLTQATNALAQFFAFLSGQSTWLRAKKNQEDFAKSLNKTGSAAKDTAGKLAAFDDLDVLNPDKGGGGGGEAGAGDLFEEVPIDPWFAEMFDRLKELWESIKPILEHIWDTFKQGFIDAAGDIKDRIANIIENLLKIKDHLIDIFTDSGVVKAAKGWFDSLIYLLGSLAGSIALVGVSLAQNLVGGIEKWLKQDKNRIKGYLIDMFDVWEEINTQLSQFAQAFANIFSVIGDENGQQVTGNILSIWSGLFGDITLLASKAGRDILKLLTQPIIDNQEGIRGALNGILGAFSLLTSGISTFTHSIGDSLNALYDNHVKPLVDNVTKGISELTSKFLELWGAYIQPALVEISEAITVVLNDYIMPIVQDFMDMLAALIDIINTLWTKYLQPIVSWLISNVLPSLILFAQQIIQIVEFVCKLLFTNLEVVTGALRTVYEFVRDIFTVGIIQAVINLKDNVIEIVESWFEKITNAWEHLKQTIDTLDKRIQEEVEKIYKAMAKFVIDTIEGLVKDAVGFWTELKDKTIEKAVKIKTDIITHWNILKTKTIEKFHELRDGVVKVFEMLKNAIKTPLNGIISFVEGMVNAVIDGINFLIGKINTLISLSSKLPSDVGLHIEPLNLLEHIEIPKLAQGAVIPPNKEFLAMLGDQRYGTNIEAPLDTIKEAFSDVVGNMQVETVGSSVMQVDGQTFARLMVPYVVNEMKRVGMNVTVLEG